MRVGDLRPGDLLWAPYGDDKVETILVLPGARGWRSPPDNVMIDWNGRLDEVISVRTDPRGRHGWYLIRRGDR